MDNYYAHATPGGVHRNETPGIPPLHVGKGTRYGALTLFPVWAEGGLFTVGDGHAVQGHGEVCVTALETCLTGTFTFVLHKRQGREPLISYPRAETTTHFISMGMHSDLDEAMRMAVEEMLRLLVDRLGFRADDAYSLVSVAIDVGVTQVVDGVLGCHAGLAKKIVS